MDSCYSWGQSISLDPFSLLNLAYIGGIYWTTGDLEKLLETGKRSVDIEPNFPGGHGWLGLYNYLTKKYPEAFSEFEMQASLYPDVQSLSNLGCAYAFTGEKEKALEIIDKIKKIPGADLSGNTSLGRIYGYMGEWDIAYQYFDKAVEYHETFLLWTAKNEIDLKDPRAQQLLEKMGQPFE